MPIILLAALRLKITITYLVYQNAPAAPRRGTHASVHNRSSYRRNRSSHFRGACFSRSYPGRANQAERPVLAEAKRVGDRDLWILATVRRKSQRGRWQRTGSPPTRGISSSSWLTLLGPTDFCGAFFMTERGAPTEGRHVPDRFAALLQENRPANEPIQGLGIQHEPRNASRGTICCASLASLNACDGFAGGSLCTPMRRLFLVLSCPPTSYRPLARCHSRDIGLRIRRPIHNTR
jgi:hypothetical protein